MTEKIDATNFFSLRKELLEKISLFGKKHQELTAIAREKKDAAHLAFSELTAREKTGLKPPFLFPLFPSLFTKYNKRTDEALSAVNGLHCEAHEAFDKCDAVFNDFQAAQAELSELIQNTGGT